MNGPVLLWLLHTLPGLAGEPMSASAAPPARLPAQRVAVATTTTTTPAAPGPFATKEATRYRVSLGGVGALGELRVSFAPPAPDGRVRAVGEGKGSLFGLGTFMRKVESEFDPLKADSHRWTSTRVQDGKTTVDHVHQHVPGVLEMVRQRPGRADHAATVARQRAVLDPVGFLLRVRVAPPTSRPEVYELLDGRALWLVTLSPGRPSTLGGAVPTRTLRIEGKAEPILWDGTPDEDRTARKFVMHLSADGYRTPLRLELPIGPSQVRVELVSLERPGHRSESFLAFPGKALRHLLRAGPRPPADQP